ncbi:MAG: hypothetical protein KME45_06080 [Stenomitos rutilans HA7619-LM2]|jgi:hypothetical protein|nr:hypothetical protein [Stenomitos rutilans HA7619-LM2]
MQRSHLDLKRETLERMYRVDSHEGMQTTPLLVAITKVWHRLSTLFHKRRNVIVQQQCDGAGKIVWHAYDPVTGCSQNFDTTTKLLRWIEQKSD